jgi:hypothetical protein
MSTTKQIIKKIVNNEKITINNETINMLEYILTVFYTRIIRAICLVINTNKRKTVRESDLIKVINIIYKINITPNPNEINKSLKKRSATLSKRRQLKSQTHSKKKMYGGGDNVFSTIKLDPVETNLVYPGFCGGNYSECMPAKVSCCTDCRSALSAYGGQQSGGGLYYLIPEEFVNPIIQKHCSTKIWTKKTVLLLRSIGVYYIVNILIKSILLRTPNARSLTLKNIKNFVHKMN